MSSIPLYQNQQRLGAAPSFGSAPAVNFSQLFDGANIANAGQSMKNLGAKITKGEMEKAAHLEETRATQKYNQGKVAKNLMVSNFKKELLAYLDDPTKQDEDMLTGAREILDNHLSNIELTRQGEATNFSGLIDEDAGTSSPFEQVNRRYAHMRNKLVDELEQEMTGFFASSGFINAVSAREEAYIKGEANNTLKQLEQDQLDEIRADPSFLPTAIKKIEDSAKFLPKAEQRERLDQFKEKAVASMRTTLLQDAILDLNELGSGEVTPANVKETFDLIHKANQDHLKTVAEYSPDEEIKLNADMAKVLAPFIKNTAWMNKGKMGEYYGENLSEPLIQNLAKQDPNFLALLGVNKDRSAVSKAAADGLSFLNGKSKEVWSNINNSYTPPNLRDLSINTLQETATQAKHSLTQIDEPTETQKQMVDDAVTRAAIGEAFDIIVNGTISHDGSKVIRHPSGHPAFKNEHSYFYVNRPKGSTLSDGDLWVNQNMRDIGGGWKDSEVKYIASELGSVLQKHGIRRDTLTVTLQNMSHFANFIAGYINNSNKAYYADAPGNYTQWLLGRTFEDKAKNLTKDEDAHKLQELAHTLDDINNSITLALESDEKPDYTGYDDTLREYIRHTKKLQDKYGGYPISRVPFNSVRSLVASAKTPADIINIQKVFENPGETGSSIFWDTVNHNATGEDDERKLVVFGMPAVARIIGEAAALELDYGVRGQIGEEVTEEEELIFNEELRNYGPFIKSSLRYIDTTDDVNVKAGINKANLAAWDQTTRLLIANNNGDGKKAAKLIKQFIDSNVRFITDSQGKPLPIYTKNKGILKHVRPIGDIPSRSMHGRDLVLDHHAIIDGAISAELGFSSDSSWNFEGLRSSGPFVTKWPSWQRTRAEWMPKNYSDLSRFKVGGVPLTGHNHLRSILGISDDFLDNNKVYKKYLNALDNNLVWIHDKASGVSTLGMRTKGAIVKDAEYLTIDGKSVQMKTSDLAEISWSFNSKNRLRQRNSDSYRIDLPSLLGWE